MPVWQFVLLLLITPSPESALLPQAGEPEWASLRLPFTTARNDDFLQYDDGTASWICWAGLYRGTWFHVGDFEPGMPGWVAQWNYLWFYHEPSYPWDISAFYCELYDGASGGPVTQLCQTSVTALHLSPTVVTYPDPISLGADFWVLENTEMSAGGWPSICGDNTLNPANHSFYSEDFIVWQPWIVQGPTANDFLMQSDAEFSLTPSSWGWIKALYH